MSQQGHTWQVIIVNNNNNNVSKLFVDDLLRLTPKPCGWHCVKINSQNIPKIVDNIRWFDSNEHPSEYFHWLSWQFNENKIRLLCLFGWKYPETLNIWNKWQDYQTIVNLTDREERFMVSVYKLMTKSIHCCHRRILQSEFKMPRLVRRGAAVWRNVTWGQCIYQLIITYKLFHNISTVEFSVFAQSAMEWRGKAERYRPTVLCIIFHRQVEEGETPVYIRILSRLLRNVASSYYMSVYLILPLQM